MDTEYQHVNFQFKINKFEANPLPYTNSVMRLNIPLLENPNKYQVAISNVSISGNYLPIQFFDNNQSIGIIYNNTLYESKMLFVPSGNFVPSTPLVTNSVYCISQLVDSVNNAITSVVALVNAAGGSITFTPRLQFNPESELFSLIALASEFDIGGSYQFCCSKMIFNQIFYSFYDTFVDINYTFSTSGLPNDYANIISFSPNEIFSLVDDPNTLSPLGTGTYRLIKQQYASANNIFKIKQLIISSQEMGIQPEIINEDLSGYSQNQQIIQPNHRKILETIPLFINGYKDIKTQIVYIPQIYRFHDFLQSDDLKSLSIYLQIADSNGLTYDFPLDQENLSLVKMVIRKKK